VVTLDDLLSHVFLIYDEGSPGKNRKFSTQSLISKRPIMNKFSKGPTSGSTDTLLNVNGMYNLNFSFQMSFHGLMFYLVLNSSCMNNISKKLKNRTCSSRKSSFKSPSSSD
jgi:hypothetical protein